MAEGFEGFEGWETVHVYTRAQAFEDGVLADVTDWARETGFRCSVALTADLWVVLNDGATRDDSIRGRAHDVLMLAGLAVRGALGRREDDACFPVRIGRRVEQLRAVVDGDGVTIGLRSDSGW